MCSVRCNKIIYFFLLILLSWSSIVCSEQAVMPSFAPAEDPAPADNIAQFQSWLKNNGQEQSAQQSQKDLPPPIMLAQNDLPPPPLEHVGSPPLTSPALEHVGSPPLTSPEVMQRKTIRKPRVHTVVKPMSFQQQQELMVKSAPPANPPSEEANIAFQSMMQKNMPLTPQQVVRLRQLIDVSQRAAAVPANIPPKPVSTTLLINLAPGTTPPAIRLAQGYVSTLLFVDSTGAPWPIASYDMGDPKAQSIQWDGKSNILLIQAIAPYGDSNIVIRLVGLPTPITLQLVSGQRVVDYRADIHVAGLGPDSKELPTGEALPPPANQLLLSVLDGVAPAGSHALKVLGGEGEAWLLGEMMYLRTRFTVLSPGWIGKMVSSDGMNAYELQRTSSVLVSQYGNPVELKIEGF